MCTAGKRVDDLRHVLLEASRLPGLDNGLEMCKEAFREVDWWSRRGIPGLWRVCRKGLLWDGNNSGGGHFCG